MKAMSGDKLLTRSAKQLASIVGEEGILEWENIAASKQQCILPALVPGTPPSCVVYPQTQAQLAEVITCAHRHKWRVLTCGSGSKLGWGGLAAGIDIVVSTERINRLIAHAIGDLTVTVEAGMKFSELQATLANSRQFLALHPTAPE